jgi:3-hydroxypropanoate dehydrogenase
MTKPLPMDTQKSLFTEARTVHAFKNHSITDAQIKELYELFKWAPTAFNAQSGRNVFIRIDAEKELLLATLRPGNVHQVKSASLTVIVAFDTLFYEHLPVLYPAMDAKPFFEGKPAVTEVAALRNSSLQGAFLIMAVRSLGFDCGAMSGFDPAKVNAEFFTDGRYKANFLLNIGVADPVGIYPRGPRLAFDEVVQII